MKRPLIALFLLACVPLLYAQKTRYGQQPPTAKSDVDYPVKVHISGIRIRQYCSESGCDNVLHADAVLNQQKVELTGEIIYGPRAFYAPRNSQYRLLPGDYSARLVKAWQKDPTVSLYYEYELLLPDRHIWRCTVTGISE
jgi:hypothetical protein